MARTYRVVLRNRDHACLEVREEETILAGAEARGFRLPVGCRYGGCITCAAKLIEGKVVQPGGTALKRRQVEAGYILLCVARPRQDCTLEVGVESHDALFVNPFAMRGGVESPEGAR